MRATRQRRLGNGLMVMGLIAFLLGLLAGPALGGDEAGFKDEGYSVSGTRSFSNNQTTFTFNVSGSKDPNFTLLISCPEGASVVSATGPSGSTKASNSTTEGHTGEKFTNTPRGGYTIVYSGDVAGAEIVIKSGGGHKHFGAQGPGCVSSTTTTTGSSTTTTASSTTTTASSTTTTTAPTTTTTMAPTTTSSTAAPTTTSSTAAPTTTSSTAAPTTTTTVDEPVGPGEETTTSSSATTSTTAAPAATTTTGVAEVGGQAGDRTTTTIPNPVNQSAGDGGQVLEPGETAGTNQQNTLPVTGTSTAAFLFLAGAALMLGGLAIRFAPPEPKQG
jgi:hypothetical protein